MFCCFRSTEDVCILIDNTIVTERLSVEKFPTNLKSLTNCLTNITVYNNHCANLHTGIKQSCSTILSPAYNTTFKMWGENGSITSKQHDERFSERFGKCGHLSIKNMLVLAISWNERSGQGPVCSKADTGQHHLIHTDYHHNNKSDCDVMIQHGVRNKKNNTNATAGVGLVGFCCKITT